MRVQDKDGNQQVVKTDEVKAEKPEPVNNKDVLKYVGDKVIVKTERGTSIEVQYAVVDASDLIASHTTGFSINEEYPKELQPRDRSRAASKLQIAKIANNLEPSFLGENPKGIRRCAYNPAPDMVVESGNGRVIALQTVFKDNPRVSEEYIQWLLANAKQFGLKEEWLEVIDSPVLVRVRISDVDRVQFVKEG